MMTSAPHQARHQGSEVTDGPPPDAAEPELPDPQHSYSDTEYWVEPGIPGRGVILTTLSASAGCTALDFVLTGGLTIFFDLCFVVVCLVAAMGVRRLDLFTAGVLPPLAFAWVVAGVTVLAPATFAADGGASKVFLTGLASHAGALTAGYAVALLTVGARVAGARRA